MYTTTGLDDSEIMFKELNHAIVNLYKTCIEETGDDLGKTDNHIEYHNYLINNPIVIGGSGGDGEWVWVSDGSGVDIKGRKIGVFGDSLTDTHGNEISKCIRDMGGEPVLVDACGNKAIRESGNATLCGGWSFNTFSLHANRFQIFGNCDHVITELITNDHFSDFDTSNKNLPITTGAMGKVASILKQYTNAKIHSVGIMPYDFQRINKSMESIYHGFQQQAIYSKIVNELGGDDGVVKHINNIMLNKCQSLGWNFIDSTKFSVYKKWHDISSKNGDGIHIASAVGYSAWWGDILKGAFGGGHWEWRGSPSGFGGGFGGDLKGIPIESVTNPKMKEMLKHVDRAESNTFGWYILRGPKNTYNSKGVRVHSVCTSGPTTWYHYYAGIDLVFWNPHTPQTSDPDTTIKNFKDRGFRLVFAGTKEQGKALKPSQLAPGDVCALFAFYASGGPTSHGAMWTGIDWRSDFIQQGIWVYGAGAGRCGNKSVLIFRHDGLQ